MFFSVVFIEKEGATGIGVRRKRELNPAVRFDFTNNGRFKVLALLPKQGYQGKDAAIDLCIGKERLVPRSR